MRASSYPKPHSTVRHSTIARGADASDRPIRYPNSATSRKYAPGIVMPWYNRALSSRRSSVLAPVSSGQAVSPRSIHKYLSVCPDWFVYWRLWPVVPITFVPLANGRRLESPA